MSGVNFFPNRGEKAWPCGCPCCGEPVQEYSPEGADNFAFWGFKCGARIMRTDHNWADNDCPDAMRMHMENVCIYDEVPTP